MNDSFFGMDLHLGFTPDDDGHVFAGPYSHVDLQAYRREDVSPKSRDLQLVKDRSNLVQSLILRLMTERGELEPLGHPNYGSRHHELIGQPNVESNRNLLKLRILECLKQELRVQRILKLEVRNLDRGQNRDKVDVEITVQPKNSPDALSFILPFNFGGPFV